MGMTGEEQPAVDVSVVCKGYGLSTVRNIQSLGGTTREITVRPKYLIETAEGRHVVRYLSQESVDVGNVRDRHLLSDRLADWGVPVARYLRTIRGASLLSANGGYYEVQQWMPGESFVWKSTESLCGLAESLSRLHSCPAQAGSESFLSSKREDHPDRMLVCCQELIGVAGSRSRRKELERIKRLLLEVQCGLDGGLYTRLPHSLIHGDLHPGNVGFRANSVSALYDLDYLSFQARSRDLVDGICFFCADRVEPFRTDDIRLLTQPFTVRHERVAVFLHAYQMSGSIDDIEWDTFPFLILSRWIQIRLRGARKVPQADRIDFVLDRFFEPVEWTLRRGRQFFSDVRRQLTT